MQGDVAPASGGPDPWTQAMRRGDFAAAWDLAARTLAGRDPATRDDPSLPYHLRWVWDGTPPDGRAVLVRCYHGYGDTLMFSRYLPLLAQRAGSVTVEMQPRLVPLFRRLMDITRAIPDIVIALLLIFVLGGGPVPAALAISFHTAGALGKMFSEVAENASLAPVEGLESVGANWVQRMVLGVLPQVAPNWLSYAALRFEINIRASAILGFVGAGGIGYELRNAISWGQGRYDAAAAVFLLLFLTIVAVDQASSAIRNRLAGGRAAR